MPLAPRPSAHRMAYLFACNVGTLVSLVHARVCMCPRPVARLVFLCACLLLVYASMPVVPNPFREYPGQRPIFKDEGSGKLPRNSGESRVPTLPRPATRISATRGWRRIVGRVGEVGRKKARGASLLLGVEIGSLAGSCSYGRWLPRWRRNGVIARTKGSWKNRVTSTHRVNRLIAARLVFARPRSSR